MNKDIKYRIVKFTQGDKISWFEVQKKNLFGKWVNAISQYDNSLGTTLHVRFKTFEEAEDSYYANLVSPTAEIVKEYER